MPMVATGVATFMSPVLATWPETKLMVPLTRVRSELLPAAARVVDHLVQDHPAIGRQAEGGAVEEADAARRVGAGLDEVLLEDPVADLKDDLGAVAGRRRHAGDELDPADRRAPALHFRLRVLREVGAGQDVDDVGREQGAVGGLQVGALLRGEIVGDDESCRRRRRGSGGRVPPADICPLNRSSASGTTMFPVWGSSDASLPGSTKPLRRAPASARKS